MPKPARTTPWIEKSDTGVYYAHWYDQGRGRTKRLSLRTKDSSEAKNRFAAFLVEGDEITRPRRDAELSVEIALQQYLREHVEPNVVDKRRQYDCVRHLTAWFGDTSISSIDIPAGHRYADARRRGLIGGGSRTRSAIGSDSTIRRELNVLLAAANHARKRKRITEMPIVESPKEHRLGEDDEAAYFDPFQIEKLLNAASGELKLFVHLAYWTGARRASIENLTRSQIDMENKQIKLQTPGKRSTKKRQPIIPILPQMESTLAVCLNSSIGRERIFETRDFYRGFKLLCAECGFEGKPHMLRHSRITHLLQQGVSIYDVARFVGDTPVTIERVYGHHSLDRLQDVLGRNTPEFGALRRA
jgi:integrase